MGEYVEMYLIIAGILLTIGGIGIVQCVNRLAIRSYEAYQNKAWIDIITVSMYILLCAFIGLLYVYSGYDSNVVFLILMFIVFLMIVGFILFCYKDREHLKPIYVILFLGYFVIVLFLTVFVRIGSVDTSILAVPLDDLREAVIHRDPSMMGHMMLNVVLFIPFGFFITAMNPHRFRAWSFAMLGGLMCSTTIEAIQMIFRLGQTDIDDIIANTIGAVIGYLLLWLIQRVRVNWTLGYH